MKACTKCGETKELGEFHKDKQKPDGHRPNCKICMNTQTLKWEKENRMSVSAKKRKSYKKNPDKNIIRARNWQNANPEQAKAIKKNTLARLRGATVDRKLEKHYTQGSHIAYDAS